MSQFLSDMIAESKVNKDFLVTAVAPLTRDARISSAGDDRISATGDVRISQAAS